MTQAPLPFASGRRNLFIEAGAGTGKTTEIVRQVLTILLDEPDQKPERIVLITFTEKAAGEIAERIRDALVDLQSSFETGTPGWPSGSPSPILAVPPERAGRWRAACERHLDHLDSLRSQTIHSFCQAILAQFPFESRVDPGFRIVEGFERARLLDQVWLDWVRAETSGEPPPDRALEWEIAIDALEGLDPLREVLFDLLGRRALLFDEGYPLSRFEEEVEPLARAAVEEIRSRPPREIALIRDEILLRVIEHFRGDAPLPRGREAWIEWLEPVAPWLRLADMPKVKDLAALKEPLRILRGGKKEENLFDLLVQDRAAGAVHRLARRFAERVDGEKDARGVLDFDDLLIRSERLLRDPEIAARARERFDFVFVDEFQDTDRLQARIVERLARDDAGFLARGRVVLVGDPKQSIYSFRRADPETYGAMLDLFVEAGAETPKLQRQFRSHPDLVAALNAMFSVLFSRDPEPNIYRPRYNDLEPARAIPAGETAGAPRIRLLRAATGDEGTPSVELEARAVAAWIASRIAAGVPAEEMAILLRKMTDVDAIVDALARAGIDYVLPRNSNVLERRSAIDLLAVLRALASPFDRGAEFSAARSPLFGLTDQEIASDLLLREMGEGPDGDTPWKRFGTTLSRWRSRAARMSVSETLDMVIGESGIEAVFRLLRRGEEMLRDLDLVRDLGRGFDREIGGSLALFADEMLRRRDGAEGEQAVLEQKARGVRILTIHASKGLEFGTVILPTLGSGTASDTLSVFTLETPPRLYMKGRLSTAATLYGGIAATPTDVQKGRAEAEIQRLFYVAVTRARNEVVFVLDPERIRQESFLKPFFAIFPFDAKQMDPLWTSEPGERVEAVTVGERTIPVAFTRMAIPPLAAERPSALGRRRARASARPGARRDGDRVARGGGRRPRGDPEARRGDRPARCGDPAPPVPRGVGRRRAERRRAAAEARRGERRERGDRGARPPADRLAPRLARMEARARRAAGRGRGDAMDRPGRSAGRATHRSPPPGGGLVARPRLQERPPLPRPPRERAPAGGRVLPRDRSDHLRTVQRDAVVHRCGWG